MKTSSTIQIRVFFDAGSGICLWAGNEAARNKYRDYPIPQTKLPISVALQSRIGKLIERYDTSIDWDYPPDPTPWTDEECRDFNEAAQEMVTQLADELAHDHEILNEFTPRTKPAEQGGGGQAATRAESK